MIIILSLLLPEASLVGNFYPTVSQVESLHSPGMMATKDSLIFETARGKEPSGRGSGVGGGLQELRPGGQLGRPVFQKEQGLKRRVDSNQWENGVGQWGQRLWHEAQGETEEQLLRR